MLRQQAFLHAALESGAGVLQAERHGDVAGVSIQEGQELTPGSGVDDLVDPREGEWILGAGLVQAGVVDTHAPGLVLLHDEDWVGQPLGVKHFHDEAGLQELGDLFTDGPSLLFGKTS